MENNSINSDFIRGHIDTIILKSLLEGDKYGYEIGREIEIKSSGGFTLKQPTLYSALKRLEGQNYIAAYWGELTKGARRKYYKITQEGKDFFEKNKNDWEHSRTIIDSLVSNKSANITNQTAESEKYVTGNNAQSSVYEGILPLSAMRIVSQLDNNSTAADQANNDGLYSTVNLYDGQPEPKIKRFDDAVILRNKNFDVNDGTANLNHLSQLNNMPEELKQKIAEKFNQAKALAAEGGASDKQLPDWIVRNSLNDLPAINPAAPITPAASTAPIAPPTKTLKAQPAPNDNTDPVILQKKADLEQKENESDKYKNKLIQIFATDTQDKKDTFDNAPSKTDASSGGHSKLSIADFEHELIVREHIPSSQVHNDNTYYVYSNKFRAVYYSVIAFFIFCELLISHFVFNILLGANIQTGYFLSAGLLALAIPLIALVFYFYNSETKKRLRFNIRQQLIKRMVLLVETAIIITLLMFLIDANLFSGIGNLSKLIIPLVLAANIVLSAPIAWAMYRLKIFSVNS